MPELLNSFRINRIHLLVLFILTILVSACGNKPKKVIEKTLIDTITQITPPVKKEVVIKKAKSTKLIPKKDTLLVKDVINKKNIRKFLLNYGKKNPETKLLLKTRLGNIRITLYKETPLHRASFIYLIKNGYYNNTCFHRIVKGFIIQAGWSDTEIVQKYRDQLNNYRIPPEFKKGVIHKRGALSATRKWGVKNPKKLSNPFEFFIMQTSVDCSHLNNEHTVFGQVTSGFSVIDKISNLKLDGHSEWPEIDVNVEFEILD